MKNPPGQSFRRGILSELSPTTRAIALVSLIIEALFIVAAFSIPENQRIFAFAMCAALLMASLAACVWLESGRSVVGTSTVRLPKELQGQAIYIDRASQVATGIAADMYRTASNAKFAGQYGVALDFYKETLKHEPGHLMARYNIGSCFIYSGRLDEAEVQFAAIISDFPLPQIPQSDLVTREAIHGCYIQLNSIYDRKKEYQKCEETLFSSLKVKPDDALSYLNLVLCAFKAGKREDAKKWYAILMKHPDQLTHLSVLSADDKKVIDKLKGKLHHGAH